MAGLKVAAGATVLLAAGFIASRAQETRASAPIAPVTSAEAQGLPVSDPNCIYFGPLRDTFTDPGSALTHAAKLTSAVAAQLPPITMPEAAAMAASIPTVPGGSRTATTDQSPENTIDKYIFPALAAANVAPAPATTDYEFVRRVYVDLTGRIPTPDQVTAFVNNTAATKRSTW